MAPIEDLDRQLRMLGEELDARDARHRQLQPYAQRVPGRRVIPAAITQLRLTKSYEALMSMSDTPWGKLIINAKLDRIEVTGISTGDKTADERLWREVWQENAMDLESKLAHRSTFLDGRAYALVWPDDGKPEILLDDATQMIVAFKEGSRRKRVAAMRRWVDDDEREFATLYLPDALYKFKERPKGGRGLVKDSKWVKRELDDEPWPLPNPFKAVPVAELRVNGQLAPGPFPYARGEFEDEIGLMDRIYLLTYLGLVVALWMGFPMRGILGGEIMGRVLKDDDGNPIIDDDGRESIDPEPPFKSRPDEVFHIEGQDVRIAEFQAADRGNLSIFDELSQLAAATSTPRHYFPAGGSYANLNGESIRAFEGPMHAAVNGSHKPSLAEGWETVFGLGGQCLDVPIVVPANASTLWADHESRSLAERADAFLKLATGEIPWMVAAELALNVSPDQIRRWETEQAGSAIGKLIQAAREPGAGS